MAGQPLYTSLDSVTIRLAGKVAIQSGAVPTDREMSKALLCQIVSDAETAVEQDLRGRYKIPFQSIRTGRFSDLPDHTRRAIRSVVDMKSCIMIMGESFGSGTHINADGYLRSMNDNYAMSLRRLLGQDMEAQEFGERRFRKSPPLDDLALSPTNIADDGYAGSVIDANARPSDYCGTGNYAADQTNDPSLGLVWFGGPRGPR